MSFEFPSPSGPARSRPMAAPQQAAQPDAPESFPLFRDIRDEFISAALVDRPCDAVLMPGGPRGPRMEAEALASGEVLDTVVEMANWVAPDDEVMEICISMGNRVHYIRPIDAEGQMYLYVALDKAKGQFIDTARMRVDMVELAFGI